MIKKIIYSALFFQLFIGSSQAGSISQLRIILDDEHRTSKFRLENDGDKDETCSIAFDYREYDENGESKELTTEQRQKIIKPVLERFRYSPRKFDLDARQVQYINFALKRKVNQKDGEVRAYVSVRCVAKKIETKNQKISLKPVLVHQIPLIIRQGKLTADVGVKDVIKTPEQVEFKLTHSGSRSVFGYLELIDVGTGDVITTRKNVAIYPGTQSRKFTMGMNPEHNNKMLKIVYTEIPSYGGNLKVEKLL